MPDYPSSDLRVLFDLLLAETKATPRALQLVKRIEELLVRRSVMPRLTGLPALPKRKTLADRPFSVRRAEHAFVKQAEDKVRAAWRRGPDHLTRKSPAAMAHFDAVGKLPPHKWPPHPLQTALAEARKIAREEFRRQAGRSRSDAAGRIAGAYHSPGEAMTTQWRRSRD